MILRPHHLLCTQMYKGRGYSQEFIENMDAIVGELRQEQGCEVNIQRKLDGVCKVCPSNIENKVCETEEKVQEMDRNVLEHFGISEGLQEYKDLVGVIKEKVTDEIIEDICGECSWYVTKQCSILDYTKKL